MAGMASPESGKDPATLDDFITQIGHLGRLISPGTGIVWELAKLQAVYDLELAKLGFTVGDKVRLKNPYTSLTSSSGWYPYRDMLGTKNLVGTVTSIDFYRTHKYWGATVNFEDSWYQQGRSASCDGHIVVIGETCFSLEASRLRLAKPSHIEVAKTSVPENCWLCSAPVTTFPLRKEDRTFDKLDCWASS